MALGRLRGENSKVESSLRQIKKMCTTSEQQFTTNRNGTQINIGAQPGLWLKEIQIKYDF
jgi:hypothetical protein